MTALLDLTTHHGIASFLGTYYSILMYVLEKLTRAAAINTVRRWVPDAVPMADMARDFALQLLRRLQGPLKTDGDGDADMDEEGQLQPEELVQTPYLPEQLTLPAERIEMLQHMEFVFALCVKMPDLLAE
jgi:symplekin